MKVYTKTGDGGTTSLIGGKRVQKSNLRLEAYGSVDELNAFIGDLVAVTFDDNIKKELLSIQNNLFVMGSALASEEGCNIKLQSLSSADTHRLEEEIDRMETELPTHNRFILPGGNIQAAKAHICRTVSRRVEREICRLAQDSAVDENIRIFINRLSDYFFVLSRYYNFIDNSEEIFWDNR